MYVADPAQDVVIAYRPDGKGGYQLLAEWSGAGTPGGAFGEVAGVAFDNSKRPPTPPRETCTYWSPGRCQKDRAPASVPSICSSRAPTLRAAKKTKVRKVSSWGVWGGAEARRTERDRGGLRTGGRVLVADTEKGAISIRTATKEHLKKSSVARASPMAPSRARKKKKKTSRRWRWKKRAATSTSPKPNIARSVSTAPHGVWLGWSTQGGWRRSAARTARHCPGASSGRALRRGLLAGIGRCVWTGSGGSGRRPRQRRRSSRVPQRSCPARSTVTARAPAIRSSGAPPKHSASQRRFRARAAGEEKMSATLEGLHAGTIYYFRIVGGNENGSNDGADPRIRNASGGGRGVHGGGGGTRAHERDAHG